MLKKKQTELIPKKKLGKSSKMLRTANTKNVYDSGHELTGKIITE